MSNAAERDLALSVCVDPTGVVRLSWMPCLRITGSLSARAVAAVDRVLANLGLAVSGGPGPTRLFTSEPAALAWLCDGAPGA